MVELLADNVSFSYGKKLAVEELTAHFPPGIYGLIGPNGAGKTTLIRLLTGMTSPAKGVVTYGGEPVAKLKVAYRQILGYMPQKQIFYEQDSVLTYLKYIASLKGITQSSERINELIEALNLSAYRRTPIKQLSGGFRQRVLLAQALLNDPIVLILDEPTAGLDPAERNHFRHIIAARSRDKITLIATHIVSVIAYIANEILIMDQGKLLIQAKQDELLERTKVYETDFLPEAVDYKISNIMPKPGNKSLYRIISQADIQGSLVNPSLDDVYIDWLTP